MSVSSRNPLRMAGANVNSGNVNTGEVNMTLGGGVGATICFSGGLSGLLAPLLANVATGGMVKAGGDVLVYSGAGRLKDIIVHQGVLSGQGVVCYDSAVPTSGGPFAASGHRLLGSIGASPPGGASGTFVAAGVYPFDTPFSSGLCVLTLSGGAGVSLTFTPETNTPNPG